MNTKFKTLLIVLIAVIFLIAIVYDGALNVKYENISNTLDSFSIRELLGYSGIEDIWKEGFYGESVSIAVIDTGVAEHKDLEKNILFFKDFINNKKIPYDDNGHGTEICGIIAAYGNNYTGIAPKANLVVLKALDDNGMCKFHNLSESIEWIIDNHRKYNIKIVCMAFGYDASNGYISQELKGMVNILREKGILVVASSGNSGEEDGLITIPGILSNVITVGSLSYNPYESNINNASVSTFSSYKLASNINKPDLLAPGENVTVLKGINQYDIRNGTSYSCAIVCGQLLLLMEKNIEKSLYMFLEDLKLITRNKILNFY